MSASTVFHATRVFDGRSAELTEDGFVTVAGGIVRDVSDQAPTGHDVVDLGDVTLMPGLIDTHVHLAWDSGAEPESAAAQSSTPFGTMATVRHALQHLAAGVTTLRDVGSPGGQAIGVAEAVRQGLIVGPRIVAAGHPIAMTGGHLWRHLSRQADGPDAVRAAVRDEVRQGARSIKLMASGGICGDADERPGVPELNEDELRAGTEEAQRLGYPVAAHAHSIEAIRNAVNVRVDSVEHGSALDEETALLMRDLGVVLSPTVTAVTELVRNGPALGVPAHVLEKARQSEEQWLRAAAIAIAMGVPIVTGTDAGVPGRAHGEVASEAIRLHELGLSPLETLRACTSRAATLLGLGDIAGRIEKGYAGDMIAVTGNPLQSVEALNEVQLVVINGRPHRPDDLKRLIGDQGV